MELIFQKEDKLHVVLSHNHRIGKSVYFNIHINPKPQIHIGLCEKNKLKYWEEMDLLRWSP